MVVETVLWRGNTNWLWLLSDGTVSQIHLSPMICRVSGIDSSGVFLVTQSKKELLLVMRCTKFARLEVHGNVVLEFL